MRKLLILLLIPSLFIIGCKTAATEIPLEDIDKFVEDIDTQAQLPDLADNAAEPDIIADTAEVDDTAEIEEPDEFTELPDEDTVLIIPTGCIQGDFKPFYGNFHAHTSNSDGELTPLDAFTYARDTGKLDMEAVTDHLEQLYTYYTLPSDEYPNCKADAAGISVDSKYLALCGFEYGSGFENGINSTGHNNVFFSPNLFPNVQTDFHDFFTTLEGCADCIAQFNHPGSEPTQTWHDFEYFPSIDSKMTLIEFNGGGKVWEYFLMALDKGWHVSPMFNEDNHSANWGTADKSKSGVMMKAINMAELKQAFTERRTFMAGDTTAYITLKAQKVCWMGSILSGIDKILVDVAASDSEPADTFTKIELFGPGQTLLKSVDCGALPDCSLSLEIPIIASTYAVARATQTDGDILVSAPIWVKP